MFVPSDSRFPILFYLVILTCLDKPMTLRARQPITLFHTLLIVTIFILIVGIEIKCKLMRFFLLNKSFCLWKCFQWIWCFQGVPRNKLSLFYFPWFSEVFYLSINVLNYWKTLTFLTWLYCLHCTNSRQTHFYIFISFSMYIYKLQQYNLTKRGMLFKQYNWTILIKYLTRNSLFFFNWKPQWKNV